MENPVHTLLAAWDSFYIISGSVAGALIGLQFVVIALIADSSRNSGAPESSIAAFGSPTVVHFSAALLVAALLTSPWTALAGLQLALAACGVAGILYVGIVIRRTLRQREYRPVLEDWLTHCFLPLLAYLALTAAAALLVQRPKPALWVVATVTLGLVFLSIHNAWDTVVYIATRPQPGPEERKPPQPRKRR